MKRLSTKPSSNADNSQATTLPCQIFFSFSHVNGVTPGGIRQLTKSSNQCATPIPEFGAAKCTVSHPEGYSLNS
ncbi:hypothetical protein DFJ75_4389 [Williamsia muralis]|uniref:Uncharacterized protein n=1 Tax=Williamsia marianensis TaxID=85044 RepID=A0A495K874_WILMA|nr:hypothetical protein DFJ75_4389 [Williamsia muralis]